MRSIDISDDLYETASRVATEAGYPNVDAFVVDILVRQLNDGFEDMSEFFTAEVMSEIHEASRMARVGPNLTIHEVRRKLKEKRLDWDQNNPG